MPDALKRLMLRFPREGKLEWIGLRSRYRAPVESVGQVQALAGQGLAGDHAAAGGDGKRQVTLIQLEHLRVVAQLMDRDSVDPGVLRRNLVVSGINLLALRDCLFAIGDVVLVGTGPAAPCSRMEEALGPGGLNAMRGHGGITARILEGGTLRVGDAVRFAAERATKDVRQTEIFDPQGAEEKRADAEKM
jgi:MOSC domain-containing protein YiiM